MTLRASAILAALDRKITRTKTERARRGWHFGASPGGRVKVTARLQALREARAIIKKELETTR